VLYLDFILTKQSLEGVKHIPDVQKGKGRCDLTFASVYVVAADEYVRIVLEAIQHIVLTNML
jgi:hypothetical protein